MTILFPFLTAYDPTGASEGTLDPLGLYQIADQLASALIPAIRERMQRIRFLTAMAVGSTLTDGLTESESQGSVAPYLIWEWLVVEALVKHDHGISDMWGVPGTLMAQRALSQHGYLDARSYLKTPRIFGFHGVYKRLAIHLGIVDVYLRPSRSTEALINAWASDFIPGGPQAVRAKFAKWRGAIEESLSQKSPRTKTRFSRDDWAELARAFDPSGAGPAEKQILRQMLTSEGQHRLGAFPALWQLQATLPDTFDEESMHRIFRSHAPEYAPLLDAIQSYEVFARSLQDAFDAFLMDATQLDIQGYRFVDSGANATISTNAKQLCHDYEGARQALARLPFQNAGLADRFVDRFQPFGESLSAPALVSTLCAHHEQVQRAKSFDGKRAWFDRLGSDRVYIRQPYRESLRDPQPGRYVHAYRSVPIRRFYTDLL